GFVAAGAAGAGAALPRAGGPPAPPPPPGPVLSLRTASRGGNVVSATVHQEHRCDLWDAAARG
ncbi:hypothetical protein ACFV8Z_49315, partial [Streptomyces sp. NPDC059837]|uniref:hypothetical protein n=1 Tax=Streptomyces sp. NPDC059837 TaxID=3346968 RepID=UPI00365B42DC